MSLRHQRWLLLCLLALTSACGSTPRQARSCQADPECPSGAYCVGGACVAGMLPEAHIQIAGAAGQLVSHRQVVFDGAGSVDPNPQHKLTSYRWALRGASASACAPSPASGSDPQLATVFRCAGDYHVELSVQNSLGLESAPITQAVAVGPSANAPVIDAQSPDLVLAHHCSGTPSTCAAVGEGGVEQLQLSVSAHDVEDGAALAYRWEVDPPPGADRSAVVFDPSPSTPSPKIRIASTGGIAGDWVLRAMVSDGDGLVTPAEIKLSIANAPPALTPSVEVAAFPHRYQNNVYTAAGTVRIAAEDPEGGSVLQPTLRLVESTPTSCVFTVPGVMLEDAAFAISASLACASAADLSPTIGGAALGAGVTRHFEVEARDGQGGITLVTLPFEVQDTPPGLASDFAVTTHGTEPCPLSSARCFAATGTAPVAYDADGDPVESVEVARSATDAASIWSSAAASFTILTDIRYPLAFRGTGGTYPIPLLATVRDPWRSSTVQFAAQIPNHAPVASQHDISPIVTYDGSAYAVQGLVASLEDPDGDPIVDPTFSADAGCGASLVGGALGTGTVQASCSRAYAWMGEMPTLGFFMAAHPSIGGTVGDPWTRASFHSTVTPAAPAPPALTATSIAVKPKCIRVCPAGEPCEWIPQGGCVSVSFVPQLASTVPVAVSATASSGGSASFTCFGGSCSASLPIQVCDGPTTVTVTLSDGSSFGAPQLVTYAKGGC